VRIAISIVLRFVLVSTYLECFGVVYGICLGVLKWLKHEAGNWLLLSTEGLLFVCVLVSYKCNFIVTSY